MDVALARPKHKWETVDKISILIPTRQRPANVERLIRSAYETAVLPPEVLVYVDDDDPQRDATQRVCDDLGAVCTVGSRIVLSEMWNSLARVASHNIMMHCGDDIIFRSHGWDQIVSEIFEGVPDKIGVVHGRDGFQDERLATHGFYHRRWMEVLGYLVPPYFSSDYNDLWNTEIADAVARRWYRPEIFTEHMHPVAGKGELDITHQERLARHERDNVAALYTNLAAERLHDVAKLRAAILQGMVSA